MKHKTLRAILAVILAVCFCVSAFIPVSAAGLFGGDTGIASAWDNMIRRFFTEKTVELPKEDAEPLDGTGSEEPFYKIVHLDCGRKYFTKDWIIALINEIAADGYTHLELAIGNDGLRFLLDDMSVTVDGNTYSSADVTAGIQAGNKAYYDFGTNELTQDAMNEIISAADTAGIEIIPLINTPGHMDAIVTAMTMLGIEDVQYNGSKTTVNLSTSKAVSFTKELVKKYAKYFNSKGCKIFNMGCDEYANDIYTTGSMGFGNLVSTGKYGSFVAYVNDLAAIIKTAGLTPMAFNDGFYFNGNTSSGTFDTGIMISFWTSGWPGYQSESAQELFNRGHKMINTNGDFYYVLGKNDQFDSGYSYASNFSNTAFMGSEVNDPAGSMFCIWCDYPNAETETEIAANTRLALRAMGLRMEDESISGMDTTTIVPYGFNTNGTINDGSTTDTDVEVTNNKTITVTAGGVATDTISGADYSNNIVETELDKSIATVSAKYEQVPGGKEFKAVDSVDDGSAYYIQASDGKYLTSSATWSEDINDACAWNVSSTGSGYRLSYNNMYLRYNSNGVWGTTTKSNNATTIYFNDGMLYRTREWDYVEWKYTYSNPIGVPGTINTTDPVDETTVTFTGVAVGTTYVTVGNTRYTINVTAEDLSTVAPLTVEYWITNGRPTDSNGSNYLTVAAQLAHAEEGIAVTSFVPVNTTKESRTLQFWRCRLLDITLSNSSTSGTEKQTEDSGDDETYNGVEFTKVRYWNGAWAVYTENNEWVEVSANHQLVAYYLEILPVADELTVTAADWGKKGDGTTSGDYLEPASSCTVSIQVVYEDGTTNPASTTAADLKSSTIAYGYWSNGRGVGTLNLVGLEGYQIWKVEAETGAMTYASSSSTWGGFTVSSFDWDDNTMTVFEDAENPVDSYVIHNDAHNPSKEGYYENLMWDENYEAILIKVYVKAPVTEDSLSVNYFVDGAPAPFYNYAINVKQGTLFDENIRLAEPWKGPLDNGSVKNILGVTQTVSADLSAMPAIDAQYRYSQYSCIRVERSEDGRVVNLYYTFSADATFVVDFGLPVVITPKELNPQLAEANITDVYVSKTPYADVTVSNEYDVVYKLNKPLDNVDTFTISYKGTNVDTNNVGMIAYTINIIPATNVYYEENFINVAENTVWSDVATSSHPDQALEKATEPAKNVYGYDPAYDIQLTETFSMGNAKKATLNLTAAAFDVKTNDALTFTFEGDGYDLISACGSDTGNLYVKTYKVNADGTETLRYVTIMDTYFSGDTTGVIGYGTKDYQVPVIRKMDLRDGYGTYKVEIYGFLRQSSGAMNPTAPAETASHASLDSPVVMDYEPNTNSVVDEILATFGDTDLADVEVEVSFVDANSVLNGGTGIFTSKVSKEVMTDMRSVAEAQLNANDYKAGSADVYVDAFRVYNPIDISKAGEADASDTLKNTAAAYEKHGEKGVKYYSLYEFVKTSVNDLGDYNDQTAIYVEYDGDTDKYTIADYKVQGPENEIYLTPGNAIAFALTGYNKDNGDIVQYSARAVTDGAYSDDHLTPICSTEMYYTAEVRPNYDFNDGTKVDCVIIRNDGSGVLAVSGLKVSSHIQPYASAELADKITEKLNPSTTATFVPATLKVTTPAKVRANRAFSIRIDASAYLSNGTDDVAKVTIVEPGSNVEQKLTATNTKAVASGRTMNYRYSKAFKHTAPGNYTYTVYAYNKTGVRSDPVTVTIEVQ